MRDQELIGLYEAYQQVHGLNESAEELEYDTQYSYEDWVNQLVEEGYDLSNWTDEGLYEYYEQLCEQILEIPQSPTPGGITPKKKPSPTPINGTPAIPPLPRKGTPITSYGESYDIVFEYLISEGYADTNENALAIMANMSEEWRQSIVEAGRLHTSSDQQVGFAGINDQESGGRGKKPMSDAEIKKQKGGQEFLDKIAATKKDPKYKG